MLWNQHFGLRSTQRLGPSLSIGVEPYVSRSYLEAGVGALNLELGFGVQILNLKCRLEDSNLG